MKVQNTKCSLIPLIFLKEEEVIIAIVVIFITKDCWILLKVYFSPLKYNYFKILKYIFVIDIELKYIFIKNIGFLYI